MNWIQLIGAVGIGAVLTKLMDIIWLQKVIQKKDRFNWLTDKRLDAYTNLSKETYLRN